MKEDESGRSLHRFHATITGVAGVFPRSTVVADCARPSRATMPCAWGRRAPCAPWIVLA